MTSPNRGKSPLNLPDFPEIHRKWDEFCQRKKEFFRKNNTSIHEFQFYTDARGHRCTICVETADEEDEMEEQQSPMNKAASGFKTPKGMAIPRKSGKSSGLSTASGSGNLRLLRKNTPVVPRTTSKLLTNETPLSYGINPYTLPEEDDKENHLLVDDTTLADISVLGQMKDYDVNETMDLEEEIKVYARARSRVREQMDKVKMERDGISDVSSLCESIDEMDAASHLKRCIRETERSLSKQKSIMSTSSRAMEEAERRAKEEQRRYDDAACAQEELQLQLNIWKQELEMLEKQ